MANELSEVKKQGIATFLGSDAVKQNITSVVGEKDVQKFISSVVSAVQANPQIAECTNSSILTTALLGHSLNLPQSPQLGYFYFVPFNNTKKDSRGREVKVKEATFQLSYKGYIQLAMRSGQYKKIHVTDIKEGELKSYNPITDEFEFEPITDYTERQKHKTIGYYAFFILANGFKKELYWDKEKMEAHAKKYSMSYRKGWSSSFWVSDFDAMAYKTLIRQLISKHGIMSAEMETGYRNDMATIDENGNPNYVDNVPDEPEKAVDVMADVIDAEVVEVENETN